MSKINYTNGQFFFLDNDQSEMILDVRTPLANRSRIHSHKFTTEGTTTYPLAMIIHQAVKKIFKATPESMAELMIYLRIVARLLRKAQIHSILHVSERSPLDEELAEILPQFNPANKILTTNKIGDYPLPENKFDTIIYPPSPPDEILLAVKNFGKIYSTASDVEENLKPSTKIFPLTKSLALFETEISPQFRQEIYRRSPQGQFNEKFSVIKQVIDKLPEVFKNKSGLDEYIAEVVRAEKLLAEIFPELQSDNIKFSFNLFKESLIDLQLGNGSLSRVFRQYEICKEEYF